MTIENSNTKVIGGGRYPRKKMASQKKLVVCIIVLLVVNLLLTTKVALSEERLKPCQRESLPCQAVPIRFVMDEPGCADKLLRSMNVTDVRILSSKILHTVRTEPIIKYWRNLSE